MEILQEYLSKIDLNHLFNILAAITAFFVAYLKLLPLIPRSSSKILSDIELLKKSEESNIVNSRIIKEAIEREIQIKYKKPTKIYRYKTFFISLTFLIAFGYFIYPLILSEKYNSTFYFICLLIIVTMIFLFSSFKEPEIEDKEKIKPLREPVFKFEIFSWGELIGGSFMSILFGFWTFSRFFKNNYFEFDWWGLLTGLFFFSGIGVLMGAFSKKTENNNEE